MIEGVLIYSPTILLDDKHMDVDVPPEVTDEGIRIVEDLLRTWLASTSQSDGEDVVMEELSTEVQVEQLKSCVDKFLPQIENNSWLQSLLNTL